MGELTLKNDWWRRAAVLLLVLGGLIDVGLADQEAAQRFRMDHLGVRVEVRDELVHRVYGRGFSHGRSAADSARRFVAEQATPLFQVSADALAERGPFPGGEHAVPLMRDPGTGTYRFTSFHYTQMVGAWPVDGSRLILLVRNEPSHPLVLASANLRPLGDWQPPVAGIDEAAVQRGLADALGEWTPFGPIETVVWAGSIDEPAPPVLAATVRLQQGESTEPASFGQIRAVVHGTTGAVLEVKDEIHHLQVSGTVSGFATSELGADFCADEAVAGLPYARVETQDGQVAFADANGQFLLPGAMAGTTLVSRIAGPFFEVFNVAGVDSVLTLPVTGGETVSLVHNAANAFEFERSQVNAYLHANLVRDFVLAVNPEYPTIAEQTGFVVNVNLNDNCNAFYSPSLQTINFFTSGEECPNTAYDTVVYHEFGHHLVQVAGSGQGAYGEGMSDSIAVLMTDQPIVGRGWRGDCDLFLRSADNNCQYSPLDCTTNCGSQIHACGRLISGSIWSLRNALADDDPEGYWNTLTDLVLSSILLHVGSTIDPSITVDLLTLDDDNEDLFDGTPHYVQIAEAFGTHGLDAPVVEGLSFSFPSALPALIDPGGATTVAVEIDPLLGVPAAGTGTLHASTEGPAGPFLDIPMESIGDDAYQAVFPAGECGGQMWYFFTAETTTGATVHWPAAAPEAVLSAAIANGITVALDDDFELDNGWSVDDTETLTDGTWQRGVPAGDGDRGDPTVDGDDSGACYLTANQAGNSDVDGGSTTLTSPIMAAGDDLLITYQRWYSNATGNNPQQDTLLVQLSTDGGDTWTDLETVGPTGEAAQGGWRQHQATHPGGAAIQLRFIAADDEPPSIVEAAIDAVQISILSCSPCPADLDHDGQVNVTDLVTLLLAWGSDDQSADIDQNGTVDVLDLIALIQNWGSCA